VARRGKDRALEVIRQAFCEHVIVLPEAAGILFAVIPAHSTF
jgi:hypothetical protein